MLQNSFVVAVAFSAFMTGAGLAAFVTVNVHTPAPAPVQQVAAIDVDELARKTAIEHQRLANEADAKSTAAANANYRRFMGR